MANTVPLSGTLVTDGNEQDLFDNTAAGVAATYQLVLNASAIPADTVLQLNVYSKVGAAGAAALDYTVAIRGGTSQPFFRDIPRVFARGARYTLKQVGGTPPLSVPWDVVRLDG